MSHLVISYLLYSLLVLISLSHETVITSSSSSTSSSRSVGMYKIEGKIVFPPDVNALHDTRILVNEGEFVGIPRIDGSFVIAGIPSGSYIVSISSPHHIFESVRVDITRNGKIRARKVNLVDSREVIIMKYPLHFETYNVPNYFEKREVFRLADFIFNPMFLTMVAPVLLLVLLPRLVPQGPDMPDAFEQANNILQPQWNLPDITDFCIRVFGGVRRRQRPAD